MKAARQWARLPGGAIVEEGLRDFAEGRQTISACLVEIARGRFARAGFMSVEAAPPQIAAELRLYRLLRLEGSDPYSRYNALVRELDSFAAAAFED